jgi:amidase
LADIVAFNAADLVNRAPFGQDLLEKSLALTLSASEYEDLVVQNRHKGASAIQELLATYQLDAILSVSNHFTGIYAPAGFPALTVPAGYRPTGEPLGVTFVGDYLSDGDLIQFAYAFEQANPVRREPTLDHL